MSEHNLKTTSEALFNAAVDDFDNPALSFWDRFAQRTLSSVDLKPGDRVLDVCCGTGASALLEAELVGPNGKVTGVDIAEATLGRARTKAADRSLENINFKAGDIEDLEFDDATFDKVICVFGVFFAPDMIKAVHELWRVLKPGGSLAITTWADTPFEPATTIHWDALRVINPTAVRTDGPAQRLNTVEKLEQLFANAGIEGVTITKENARHPIGASEDWWRIVKGTAFRVATDRLSEPDRQALHDASIRELENQNIGEIEVNTIYAIVSKPV